MRASQKEENGGAFHSYEISVNSHRDDYPGGEKGHSGHKANARQGKDLGS
jgi:hypothetical protein